MLSRLSKHSSLSLALGKRHREALVTAIARVISFLTERPVTQMLVYRDTEEALELIDWYSRMYFPSVFGFITVRIKYLILLNYGVQIISAHLLAALPLHFGRRVAPQQFQIIWQ